MDPLKEILAAGLLSPGDIARILGVSQRSVERWARGDVGMRWEALEHLLEVKVALDLAMQLMSADAGMWLRSPQPSLGYDKPLDILQARGYRRVIASLQALGEGGGAE